MTFSEFPLLSVRKKLTRNLFLALFVQTQLAQATLSIGLSYPLYELRTTKR
jgi:hypothetical protein